MRRWLIAAVFLAAGGIGFWWYTRPASLQPASTSLAVLEIDGTPEFARVTQPRPFTFPADHGPHPEYQTEWWYYTGNLQTQTGRRFAYQLTFFRRALPPRPPERPVAMAADQIYFAHFAITDVEGRSHRFVERFSRDAAGLAGAQPEPFRVWLEQWSVEALDDRGDRVRLIAESAEVGSVVLELTAMKPIVAHGDDGLSPKSEEVGNASYYLSFTRMRTNGEIQVNGESFRVEGESWFDHEWSTSALGPEAVGWDWFSLQLSDGRELMIFQIRRRDGTVESVSGGTLVELDGRLVPLRADDIDLRVLDTWSSPESGAVYPSGWRIEVPSADLSLTVEPLISDQEMRLFFTYWEGAVQVTGESDGAPVAGFGFVELTGYKDSMQGVF